MKCAVLYNNLGLLSISVRLLDGHFGDFTLGSGIIGLDGRTPSKQRQRVNNRATVKVSG